MSKASTPKQADSRPASNLQTPQEQSFLNPREVDFLNSKSYFLTQQDESGVSLYEHLVVLLRKILEDKPQDALNSFEDLSCELKRARFAPIADTIQNKKPPTNENVLAEIQRKLFKPLPAKQLQDTSDEDSPLPNLMQTAFFFEQAGIGLNREETVRVWLALRQLVASQPIQSVRFWGKMLGVKANYYVAEVDLRESAAVPEEDDSKMAIASAPSQKPATAAEEDEPLDEPPKPDWKPPPVVPNEDNRSGANKKTYYVCSEPGQEWVRLPSVTPTQISTSRQIRKLLTGDLDSPVVSHPPFPGRERHLLRAQIARISASTQVSPLNFYQFDEEEAEEEEEGGGRTNFIVNPDFEPIPVGELMDSSMANWAHHVSYLLPQGRTTWWNPASAKADAGGEEGEDEDEDEEVEEADEPEPETGPPLLNPLSEDAEIEGTPAWSSRLSSSLVPHYAIAIISSNLWPGAYAFATGRTFENVYLGWGLKYSPTNYSPTHMAPPLLEFSSGPEITETEDPTPEMEAAFRASQAEAEGGAEEEAEEEEDEEEEGDDD